MTEEQQIVLDETQARAVELALSGSLCIVTGGPGTGKTTICKAIIQEFRRQEKEAGRRYPYIGLAAPTGKAARRIRDAVGEGAQTLHRLLGWTPMGAPEHPVDVSDDMLIVDEVSMVDNELMAGLMRAIDPRRTRLVLVGDANQLPSVGAGQILRDLMESGKVPVVRLETLHRAARESWIFRNAPRVLDGDLASFELQETHDFRFVEVTHPDQLQASVVSVFEQELNRAIEDKQDAGLREALDEVQLITPMRVGPVGTDALNLVIQRGIQGTNGGDFSIRVSDDDREEELAFLENDKIIQTRNNYDLNIMNGETGIVLGSQDSGKRLVIEIDGTEHVLDKGSARDLRLAYAITIHKSQGGQAPVVVVVAHSVHSRMLNRALFYTAITRARQRVVIVGDRLGLERAIRNQQNLERQTGLRDRVRRAVGA